MLRSVFGKTLWDQRRSLLGWAIGISAVGVLYAVFYPTINTPEMLEAVRGIRKASSMRSASRTSHRQQATWARRRSASSARR